MGVGRVYIVGAGPGAHDLITLRGLRALRKADLVVCDSLLPRTFLDELGVLARVVWLKAGGRRSQSDVNTLIYQAAREGKHVVRLKGGDPFLYGRGNEEAAFLMDRGVPWEVIPGPSVSTAALTAAGLPLSWREKGRSFAFVTAREAGGAVVQHFPRADSLAVFMGVEVLDEITHRLLGEGWEPGTPSMLIERATLPWETHVEGSLSEIARIGSESGIAPPALLVVGEAVSHSGILSRRPRILFTGLDPSNFRHLGQLLHWPALSIERCEGDRAALPEVIEKLKKARIEWVVFTSRYGVRAFFEAVLEESLDARLLAGTRIAVAGAGTAATLGEYGLRADRPAREPGSRGIIKGLGTDRGGEILLVQGSHAPPDLERMLKEKGFSVIRLALHRALPHPGLGRPLPTHDVIYFTSPSGVRAYWSAYGGEAFQREIWCIGDVTLAGIAERGLKGKVVNPHVP